jgi:hypothetical protein
MSLKTSEIILNTISALGKIRIEKFNDLFDTVWNKSAISEEGFAFLRGQALRFLDALGHAEYDYDKRYLYVCSPLLILLPTSGLPRAVLTGARTTVFMKELKTIASNNRKNVSLSFQSQSFMEKLLPCAVYLEAIDKEMLKNIAGHLKINYQLDFPASWSILNFSDGVKEIEKTLKFEPYDEINWQQREFSKTRLTFTTAKISTGKIRLVEYTNRVTYQKMHWLWKDNSKASVNRDWGRYILLSELGVNVLYYDSQKYQLAVPLTVPLPVLIARAITLCSGLVPRMINFNDCDYLVYSSIDPNLANEVAGKLGQAMIEISIDNLEN